eukprot:gene19093-22828_t
MSWMPALPSRTKYAEAREEYEEAALVSGSESQARRRDDSHYSKDVSVLMPLRQTGLYKLLPGVWGEQHLMGLELTGATVFWWCISFLYRAKKTILVKCCFFILVQGALCYWIPIFNKAVFDHLALDDEDETYFDIGVGNESFSVRKLSLSISVLTVFSLARVQLDHLIRVNTPDPLADIRGGFVKYFQYVDLAETEQQDCDALVHLLNDDLDRLSKCVGGSIFLLSELTNFLAIFVLLTLSPEFVLSTWPITVFILTLLPLLILYGKHNQSHITEATEELNLESLNFYRITKELIEKLGSICVLNIRDASERRLRTPQVSFAEGLQLLDTVEFKNRRGVEFFQTTALMAVIGIGASLVVDQDSDEVDNRKCTPGTVVAYFHLADQMFRSLAIIIALDRKFQMASPSLRLLTAVLSGGMSSLSSDTVFKGSRMGQDMEQRQRRFASRVVNTKGRVTTSVSVLVDQLNFNFSRKEASLHQWLLYGSAKRLRSSQQALTHAALPHGAPKSHRLKVPATKRKALDGRTLKGVHLAVQAGHKVAIVGGAGAGKSTLLKCIAKLYQTSSGQITFDGVPLHAVDAKKMVAMMEQNSTPFDGTIGYVPKSHGCGALEVLVMQEPDFYF